MQRTIEIADFEFPRGPVTISALMAMKQADWEHIRSEITRRRIQTPEHPLARCRLCKLPVYIRSTLVDGEYAPLFAHYGQGPNDRPWNTGNTLKPDAARAAQYQGHQESALHEWMCETIAKMANADPRCSNIAVDTYRRPAIEQRGRWPDIYLEMAGVGHFALEVQLSKPFAVEIAARHIHYERENVSLIWIFREIDSDPPQGFRDVITMQRGNVFLFDDAALKASIEQSQLMLTCLLERPGGYLKPQLVGLDQLKLGGRAVYLEDRRTKSLLDFCKDGRALWWKAFRTPPGEHGYTYEEEPFERAWSSIRTFVPSLSSWKANWWRENESRGQPHFAQVAAILFSIIHTAVAGEPTLHISNYKGQGALIAMLNSKLTSIFFKPYATMFDTFLSATSLAGLIERDSLQRHILLAKLDAPQIAADHPIWEGARRLFPEVLNGIVRAELADLDQLPAWAIAPKS